MGASAHVPVERPLPGPETVIRPALVTAPILLTPFAAMPLGDGVSWSLSNSVVMGALLFGTGLAYERMKSLRQKLALVAALLAGMQYVRAELAVGVFPNSGSRPGPNN